MEEIMVFLEPYPELKPYIALGLAITVLLAPFHFIMGFIKPPISALVEFLKKQFYREISIYVADPEYAKFNLWLDKNAKFTSFKRQFKIVSASGGREEYDDSPPSKLVSGYGSVLVKAPNQPFVWVTRAKDDNKMVYQQTETLTFRVLSLRQKAVFDLFKDVVKIKEDRGPFIYKNEGSWWGKIGEPKQVLPPIGAGALEFIEDVKQWIDEEEEYTSKALPYKRGYLLYGPPGTGKSSILAHIAKLLGMNIYLLDSLGITNFSSLTNDVKKKSIILIEDIDMTIAGNGRKNTLSSDDKEIAGTEVISESSKDKEPKNANEALRDFLNALDGIVQFDGAIVVVTTNKPSVLDPALLRPGRIDRQIEIGLLSPSDQISHFNRFFNEKNTLISSDTTIPERTFAQLQYICSSNMKDANAAWNELVNKGASKDILL